MFSLPNLKFSPQDLEPYISAETISYHHGKHHQSYIDKLNELLAPYPEYQDKSLTWILGNLEKLPEEIRDGVRKSGGQHFNHSLYWDILRKPKQDNQPGEELLQILASNFRDFETFKEIFSKHATSQFGSGWAWLSIDKNKKLFISNSLNADNPAMEGATPILTCDVWEHAYYLDYQNRRPDYVRDFWYLVNWDVVFEKYETAINE